MQPDSLTPEDYDELDVKTIPNQIAQMAKDAGWEVVGIEMYPYKTSAFVEFELYLNSDPYEEGFDFVCFLIVDYDGNVTWYDFNKKFQMGNVKQPERIVDNFFKIKDGGGGHKELQWNENRKFDKACLENAIFPLTKKYRADDIQLLVLAKNTGRLLLARRKPIVGEGIWGMWNDVREEAGYTGRITLIQKSKLKYNIGRYNFISILGVVPEEFIPTTSGEVQNYKWAILDELSGLSLHDNLKVYSKAVSTSLEKFYKEFINENNH